MYEDIVDSLIREFPQLLSFGGLPSASARVNYILCIFVWVSRMLLIHMHVILMFYVKLFFTFFTLETYDCNKTRKKIMGRMLIQYNSELKTNLKPVMIDTITGNILSRYVFIFLKIIHNLKSLILDKVILYMTFYCVACF